MDPKTIDKVWIRPAKATFSCKNPDCSEKALLGHVIITYTGLLQQCYKTKTSFTFHADCANHDLAKDFPVVQEAYELPVVRDFLLKLPAFYVVPREIEWEDWQDKGMLEGPVDGSCRVSKRPFLPHCNLLKEQAALVDVKGDGHCLGHVLEYFGIVSADNLRTGLAEFYRKASH